MPFTTRPTDPALASVSICVISAALSPLPPALLAVVCTPTAACVSLPKLSTYASMSRFWVVPVAPAGKLKPTLSTFWMVESSPA